MLEGYEIFSVSSEFEREQVKGIEKQVHQEVQSRSEYRINRKKSQDIHESEAQCIYLQCLFRKKME